MTTYKTVISPKRFLVVAVSSVLFGLAASAWSQGSIPGQQSQTQTASPAPAQQARTTPATTRPPASVPINPLYRQYTDGLALLRAGHLHEAQAVFLAGAETARQKNYPIPLFNFLFVLGNISLRQGHPDEAFDYYNQAEPLADASRKKQYITSVDLALGKIYQSRGRFDQAQDYFSRALPLLEEIDGTKFLVANTYYERGNAYAGALQLDKAFDDFTQSLTLYQKLNSKVWIAGCLTRLGYVSYGQKHFDKAQGYYTQALTDWQAIGSKPQIANSEYYLAIVYRNAGQLDKALATQLNALDILENLNAGSQDTANCLMDLGEISHDRKDWGQCLDYYNRALTIELAMNNKRAAAEAYMGLSDTYTQLGQRNKARSALGSARRMSQ